MFEVFILLLGLAAGFAFGALVIYGFWRFVSPSPLKVDLKRAAYYMAVSFPICIILEVAIGVVHQQLFHKTLWQYRIFPIHGGFTSVLNFAFWPLYGLHWYFSEQVAEHPAFFAAKIMLGGPVLEIVANGCFFLIFRRYYFYYFPTDLWHLTSLQVVPYYASCSLLFWFALTYFKRAKAKRTVGLLSYASGLLFLIA